MLKSKEHPTYTPLSITVALRYNYQVNYAYFDHIQVIKDVASSYTYDKDGNVVSAAANSEQKSSMTYEDSDLTEVTDSAGYNFKYEYDDNHNVIKATSARGLVSSFTRAIYGGMVKESTLSNSAGTSKIKTETKYTSPVYKSDGTTVDVAYNAYVKATTDQHGYETKYEYDTKKGLLTKVTDPMNNATTYEYVSANDDRIKAVKAAGRTVTYGYTGDNLSSLSFSSSSHSNVYTFANNAFGNPKYTYINGKMLSNNIYNVKTGQIASIEYGNNFSKKFTYNNLGLQTNLNLGIPGSESNVFRWKYDSKGTLLNHTDFILDTQYNYTYDAIGRLIRETHLDSNDLTVQKGYVAYSYDIRNNLTKLNLNYGGRSWSNKYSYSAIDGRDETASYAKDNLPTRFTMTNSQYADYYYDNLNRITKRVFTFGSGENAKIVNQYSYNLSENYNGTEDGVTHRTTQLGIETINNTSYHYTYDKNGNIIEIAKGEISDTDNNVGAITERRTYEYDALNQLTKEISGTTTTTYSYGNLCNMTRREIVNTDGTTKTTTYTYGADPDSDGDGQAEAGWSNLLLSVTTDGTTQTIDYDEIGNPTSYLGATLTWKGRDLRTIAKDGNTITYFYDENGLRTTKNINGVKSRYTYVGDKLYYEKNGDKDIYLWYDSYGNLAAIQVNEGNTVLRAFAATNSQGDVLGLYDASGNQIVSYEYDSWGNLISMTDTSAIGIGTINPIRYRGYYYDTETGFYYLQSRYYDPQTGRFISPEPNADFGGYDAGAGILGYNLYAYCANNPVIYKDDTGEFILTAIIVGAVVGAASVYAGDVVENIADGKKGIDIIKPRSSVGTYLGAAASGMIYTSNPIGFIARPIVSTTVKFGYDCLVDKKEFVKDDVVADLTLNFVGEGLSYGVNKALNKAQPQNYSSFRNQMTRRIPKITQQQTKQLMYIINRSVKSISLGLEIAIGAITSR